MRARVLILTILVLLFALRHAAAGTPPAEPILRIETGMHTALIKRIAVDGLGRYLATASDDKTCRVWDIKTGEELRVLRPPIGHEYEGRLYSVAMSPDGRYVFCGGWSGYGWDKAHSVYVFERESGRLMRRLTGLPSVVNHLTVSHDGAYLAAALGEDGVRVWRLSDLALVGQDKDYTGESYGAAFDGKNHLATACYDGLIRLYRVADTGLTLVAKVPTQGGKRPFSLAFSPDGSQLAVGFTDTAAVTVLDGETLALLGAPNLTGVDNGNLASVAFAADGSLLAGGRWVTDRGCPIRSFKPADFVAYRDLDTGKSAVVTLCPLPDGGLAYGTVAPRWGVLRPDGSFGMTRSPAIQDFRSSVRAFYIDRTGETVAYAVGGRKGVFRFALPGRDLRQLDAPTPDLAAPRTQGLAVTGWEGGRTPLLNGQPLKLKEFETAFSLALTPDNRRFVLGTSWNVRAYGADGAPLWQTPAPDAVWAVNVSGDGRVAVAAVGDGSIRWYRMEDGREILSFFPNADGKRWVLWTQTGYYDASPGGEDMIGWNVNNGPDHAADFFPASRFRDAFHRPDVIDLALRTLDENKALAAANVARGGDVRAPSVLTARPPVVEILSPAAGSGFAASDMTVKYAVRSPGGEDITAVRVLLDGARVDEQRPNLAGRGLEPSVLSAKLALPEHDVVLSVVADNKNGPSAPATVRLKWTGKAAAPAPAAPAAKLYVLAVGAGAYADKSLALAYPAKDAKDFAAAMELQKGRLYGDVVTRVLTDEAATKDAILNGLDWIERQTTQHDVAMIFLAGHGVNDKNGDYYFLPTSVDLEKLRASGLPFMEVQKTIRNIAGKTLFFVDTCHSGSIMGASRRGMADLNGVINELSSAGNGAIVFAASTGRQYSLEKPEWQNGAFTKALVEGVRGRADNRRTGRVTFKMLDLYISERVKELTAGEQTPTTGVPGTVEDFPIAAY